MKIATKSKIYEIDSYAENTLGIPAHILMYNAGASAAEHIKKLLGDSGFVCILCGKGKNGGDGYVIAGELFDAGYSVCVFESECTARDASSALYREKLLKKTADVYSIADKERVGKALLSADVIIDALFGVGFRGGMPACEAYAVELANSTDALRIAVDIPSGVEADSGRVSDVCFSAHHTMTMEYIKRGMLIYPGRSYTGNIHICSIGVDRKAVEENIEFSDRCVTADLIRECVISRPAVSHKGTFGRLLCICGSDGMPGAAVLSCEGALRMGVGLCELVCTEKTEAVVACRLPETVFSVVDSIEHWTDDDIEKILSRADAANAVVIGCGATPHKNLRRLLKKLLGKEGCPVLIDADGLNCIGGDTRMLSKSKRAVVITPHPKELSRLCGIGVSDILCDAYTSADSFCRECGAVVLLKGASTVIASPDGRHFINVTGNSGLAKAGTGDVLSGMIGALLARGTEPAVAAALGAHIHGAAADLLKEEIGECGILAHQIPLYAAKYLAKL